MSYLHWGPEDGYHNNGLPSRLCNLNGLNITSGRCAFLTTKTIIAIVVRDTIGDFWYFLTGLLNSVISM